MTDNCRNPDLTYPDITLSLFLVPKRLDLSGLWADISESAGFYSPN